MTETIVGDEDHLCILDMVVIAKDMHELKQGD